MVAGNLSQRALTEFILWFLRVCLDQVTFMSGLFEIDSLMRRLRTYVERHDKLKPEAARLLEEALIRGEFDRGEVSRIAGLPERTARRLLNDVIATGLLCVRHAEGRGVTAAFRSTRSKLCFPACSLKLDRRCLGRIEGSASVARIERSEIWDGAVQGFRWRSTGATLAGKPRSAGGRSERNRHCRNLGRDTARSGSGHALSGSADEGGVL